MPVCFQLFPKDNPEAPEVLNVVDEKMCQHFAQPCDPVKYLNGWFDAIGFRLACGKSFAEIKAQFEIYIEEEKAKNDQDGVDFYKNLILINDWLDERYTTNSFYSRHKD